MKQYLEEVRIKGAALSQEKGGLLCPVSGHVPGFRPRSTGAVQVPAMTPLPAVFRDNSSDSRCRGFLPHPSSLLAKQCPTILVNSRTTLRPQFLKSQGHKTCAHHLLSLGSPILLNSQLKIERFHDPFLGVSN